jgi:hypothetical protein
LSQIRRTKTFILALSLIILGITAQPIHASAKTVYNVDRGGIAIRGYDPVAYFTMSKPVKVKKDIEAVRQGAT